MLILISFLICITETFNNGGGEGVAGERVLIFSDYLLFSLSGGVSGGGGKEES